MPTYVLTFVEHSTKYALIDADNAGAAIGALRRGHREGNITGVDTGDYEIVAITDVREDRSA